MSIRPILLCLFLTLFSVRCSDSLLKGQISFSGSNQTACIFLLMQSCVP